MPEPVPVSPAAQAVDGGPPDLWWSPGLAADTLDAQDGVVTADRGQLYRQQNATWRYIEALPADAVRLVPAPGPDLVTVPRAWLESASRDVRNIAEAWAHLRMDTDEDQLLLDRSVSLTRRWADLLDRRLAGAAGRAAGVRTDGETPR